MGVGQGLGPKRGRLKDEEESRKPWFNRVWNRPILTLLPHTFPPPPHSLSPLSLPPVLDTVMKSCSYKAFCDKARNGNSGAKMECCFTDDCNGPHKGHQHGEHKNTAGALGASPALLLGALMLRMALSRF